MDEAGAGATVDGESEVADAPPAEDELEEELDVTDLSPGDGGDETGPEARLVVYGDFDFAADGQIANAANGMLLLKTPSTGWSSASS